MGDSSSIDIASGAIIDHDLLKQAFRRIIVSSDGWPNERILRCRETAADLSVRVESIIFTRRMTLHSAGSANNRNAKFLQITQLENSLVQDMKQSGLPPFAYPSSSSGEQA